MCDSIFDFIQLEILSPTNDAEGLGNATKNAESTFTSNWIIQKLRLSSLHHNLLLRAIFDPIEHCATCAIIGTPQSVALWLRQKFKKKEN